MPEKWNFREHCPRERRSPFVRKPVSKPSLLGRSRLGSLENPEHFTFVDALAIDRLGAPDPTPPPAGIGRCERSPSEWTSVNVDASVSSMTGIGFISTTNWRAFASAISVVLPEWHPLVTKLHSHKIEHQHRTVCPTHNDRIVGGAARGFSPAPAGAQLGRAPT
jgi:hypothetical protein